MYEIIIRNAYLSEKEKKTVKITEARKMAGQVQISLQCMHRTCTNITVTFTRHFVDKAISGTPINCTLTSSLEGELLNLRATYEPKH